MPRRLRAIVLIWRHAEVVRQLRATGIDVQIGAQDLAGPGEGILNAISMQTSGAAEQSAAIAQTSATVEEVKASAQQATQLAESVASSAREADRIAAEGVAAIDDANGGMAAIRDKVELIAEHVLALSEQTQQIGDIIATVGDLADQSNMLALNAAIEATRAGEHGRGFAIVAQEIRVLAEQSKVATAQVRTILGDIQRADERRRDGDRAGQQGSRGRVAADRSGWGDDYGLATVIQETSSSAQQIAVAARQHSVGMEQIDGAMADISRATGMNLEAATASGQAAQALIALADRLNHSVDRYRAAPGGEDLERLALAAHAGVRQSVIAEPSWLWSQLRLRGELLENPSANPVGGAAQRSSAHAPQIKLYVIRVGGACGRPPPVAAALASSLRAPSRGDPPLRGRGASHLPARSLATTRTSRTSRTSSPRTRVCSGSTIRPIVA